MSSAPRCNWPRPRPPPRIAQGRAVLENALAVLSGQTASFFKIAAEARQPATPRPPHAAPAALLLRRPDIAANERLLFAANERIGAAKADFLPRFYILLSGGTQSTNLDLLNFHNSLWSYGPSVTAPVFDGGQRQAQLDIARAGFQARCRELQVIDFRGLSGSRRLPGVDQAARAGTCGADGCGAGGASRARHVDESYKDGAASSLDVVTSQSAALDAERAEARRPDAIAGAICRSYAGAGRRLERAGAGSGSAALSQCRGSRLAGPGSGPESGPESSGDVSQPAAGK